MGPFHGEVAVAAYLNRRWAGFPGPGVGFMGARRCLFNAQVSEPKY
jgi:hypothetical protein